MIARVLALVLALLLVGGAAGRAAAEAPASTQLDAIGAIAEQPVIVATTSAEPPARTLHAIAIRPAEAALLGAGRASIDSIFRPPRTPAS